jgi:transcriptional regulator with XRE-family HTH domain
MTTIDVPEAARRRRTALGEFLKARRARVRPEDVGLAPGPRRRTAGLRREEVAIIAGVSPSWYTWLEQGREINVSGQVLDAVARALRLNQVERKHLYQLAEAAPQRATVTTVGVPAMVHQVLDALDPMPATLVNAKYDWIASNDAYGAMFSNWHSLPCVHQNPLWCCIVEPTARKHFLNYDEEVPHMVARLRAEYGKHIGDPEWEEDIRRLCDVSPEFKTLWARHEVAEPQIRRRQFMDADVGLLTMTTTELVIPAVADLRFLVYKPEDQATWDRLAGIRRLGRKKATPAA